MALRKWLTALLLVSVCLVPVSAQAKLQARELNNPSGIDCQRPESNATGLVILHDFYPGYWWDHTDVKVAIQAHPSTKAEQMAAIRSAIATWSSVIASCFGGRITVTDVTDSGKNPQKAADIVVHYVPRAGGVVFGGYAICGEHGCPNILVRSDLPPSQKRPPYDPEYLGWVTLHELGHALGLGHATNLLESTDLMGYGWPDLGEPVLSDCDIDAIAHVFAWVFEGSAPHPPTSGPYDCALD